MDKSRVDPTRRATLKSLLLLLLPGRSIVPAGTAAADAGAWADIEARARGTTVYLNAWGGDDAINRYIAWAGHEVRAQCGVTVVHVKVTDISETVTRVLAERAAGRMTGGTVDLMWLNGENFAALRTADLLYGPWTARVPNAALIDVRGNPTTVVDFTLPTGGYEIAWGSARFTLFYESNAVGEPPRDPGALLRWIQAHPGRFTYPRPPDFIGTSFLKQVLILLAATPQRFAEPVGGKFGAASDPLWRWLDAAHPSMWRGGRLFPASGPAERELLAVGELDWAMAFNPADARRAIARGELPMTVRATTFAGGALANSHFLAIPFNSRHVEGAQVVANFLLSPEAQARKADVSQWGDPTVLDVHALTPRQQSWFDGPSDAVPPRAHPEVAEPHPSWTAALERAWLARYGVR